MTVACERLVGQAKSLGQNFTIVDSITPVVVGAASVLYNAIPVRSTAASGGLSEVRILTAGLGYRIGDLLTLAQAGGSEADGVVKVLDVRGDGSLKRVTVSTAGTVYVLGVTATVGSGGTSGSSGATFTVVSVDGAETYAQETVAVAGLNAALAVPGTTYAVTVGGIAYTLTTDFTRSTNDLTFTPGTVALGGLKQLTMTNDGVGYAAAETIALSQTGGTEANGVVTVDTVDGTGQILTWHISAAGTAYTLGALTSANGSVAGTGAVFTAARVGKWPTIDELVTVTITTGQTIAFPCPTTWTTHVNSSSTGALVVSATTGAAEAYEALTVTNDYALAAQVVTLTAAGLAKLTPGTDLVKISHTFVKWNKIPTSYTLGTGEVVKVYHGAAATPADADTLKTVTTHYVVTDATVVTLADADLPLVDVWVTVVLRSPVVIITAGDFLKFDSSAGGYNYRQFVPAATTAGAVAYGG
jgi:hypothetical protein